MNSAFILNPALTNFQIKDAIEERLGKLQGVLSCLMLAAENINSENTLDDHSLYHALWALYDYVVELNHLQTRLAVV